jgi:hypothetical protein
MTYPCGCIVTKDLNNNLLTIQFCPIHQEIFSPDKNLTELYQELMASPDFLEGIHLHRIRG